MLKKRILFVCLGNICRSPMAQGVFQQLVKDRNLIQCFELDSAGTGAYHSGSSPDQRALATCQSKGIILSHKARQVNRKDFEVYDYIVAMDTSNLKFLKQMGAEEKLLLMRDFDFDATSSKDVPDPYYGGVEGFENVYEIVLRSSKGLLDHILNENVILKKKQ